MIGNHRWRGRRAVCELTQIPGLCNTTHTKSGNNDNKRSGKCTHNAVTIHSPASLILDDKYFPGVNILRIIELIVEYKGARCALIITFQPDARYIHNAMNLKMLIWCAPDYSAMHYWFSFFPNHILCVCETKSMCQIGGLLSKVTQTLRSAAFTVLYMINKR